MATVKRNNLEIYYEVRGEGPPLLLVPGLASDSQSWLSVITDLAKRFRVIAVDNRGSGRTTPMEIETGISPMADDCLAVLDAIGIPSAHVLGHSMGGFIAQDLAVRHPERASKLVLVATGTSASRRNLLLFRDWADAFEAAHAIPATSPAEKKRRADALGAWFRTIFYWIFAERFFEEAHIVQGAVEYSIEYPFPQSPAAFRRQVEACAGFHGEAALERIKAKALVVAGRRDLLFPIDGCEAFAKRISGAVFAEIRDAAHSVHVDCPRQFLEIVIPFLETL